MAISEKPSIRTARSAKIVPGTALKRLPWLDGKTSQAVSVTPEDDHSPTARPSFRKPSVSTVPKRTSAVYRTTDTTNQSAESVPLKRKKPISSPTKRRMTSIGSPLESSPSPVTRHRMAQSRRESMTHQAASHRTSASHEPRKRLSIVDAFNPSIDEGLIHQHRLRADSLAPVPDHLERSSTSDSVVLPVQHDEFTSTTAPVVVSRAQVSPSRPRPGRSAFERVGDRRISNAIEGLEDMVQEAVEIADDTADHGQVEEIYDIIEDARQAIQEASGDPARHLMVTGSPLPASDSSEAMSGWNGYNGHQRDLSPPRPGRTPPPPPPFIRRNIVNDSADLAHPQMQTDLQRESTSIDWAYQPHRSPTSATPSYSDLSSDERGRSRLSTRSDLLLPPNPTQAAQREHVDFVLRPMVRDHSRGRPHRRITRDSAVRSRKHHRHHRFRSLSSPDREARSRSISRHRKRSSSDSSPPEESFEEEDLPSGKYGNNLYVREQAHQHTFSLRRHHRRQPIARNWGTGKKRLTAIIACINTAFLGIIIGVYVSNPESSEMFDL